ncbi:hypothetical protein ACM41_24300 [Bradyrhizobium sp. CCBAU 21362]|uniref:hypothetical protein n=1 Tax=Bradyrhizobium sp. CCBAU 21362 TaxID=1325082 RepID=UPI002306A174|nr:hypothetical protein [Bradyrhizobium sp. CCBAU 21362]MDA9539225.1 hypothetical protein [Bradyrhizobium sp. CCBAU 21362]
MSVPFLSVKPRAIKLHVLPQFPADVIGRAGIDVSKANGKCYFDLDYTDFPTIGSVPSGTTYALIFDPATGKYSQMPISLLGGGIADAPSDSSAYGRKNAAWSKVLDLAGGTLTGPLMLAADPAVALGAATKQYVDSHSGGIADAPSDGAPYGRLNAAWAKLRTPLTANRTYYVSTTGNDANDGLTPGTPFLTIQKALNVVYGTLDLGGQTVTIQLTDGAYTQAAIIINGAQVGAGTIRLIGNTTTPANVVVTGLNDNGMVFNGPGSIFIDGMEVRAQNGYGVKAGANWVMTLGANMRYGTNPTYSQIYASNGGRITCNAGNIVGSAGVFGRADYGGYLLMAGAPINLTGTPNFTNAFVVSDAFGFIDMYANTITGTATGARYTASHGGAINTNGGGINYLPGNAAGSSTTGFYY